MPQRTDAKPPCALIPPKRNRAKQAARPAPPVPSFEEARDVVRAHGLEHFDMHRIIDGLHQMVMPSAPQDETTLQMLFRMGAGVLRDDVRTFWRIAGTRPVLSPHLQEVARPFWQEKWDQHKTDPCPVCFAERGEEVVWDGPMNSAYPTRCNHRLCTACWQNLVDHTPGAVRCPVCREDVTDWAMGHYEAEE